MTTNPIIVLDLDDVLANLRETLYQVLSQATGIDKHWRTWPDYNLRNHFQVDDPFLEDLFVRERVLEVCDPEPLAAQATDALVNLGFELQVITARSWNPDAYQVTANWLQRHRISYHNLHITSLGGNKLEAIENTQAIAFAVDDHPNNVRRYQQVGIPTLMPDQPWNVDYNDATRIHSLQAVIDYAEQLFEK